jgi:hypothetical protein
MTRERDLSFERLAEVCARLVTPDAQLARRAQRPLAGIREAHPELEDTELVYGIEAKAATYRKVMEGSLLTPTALAKHWPNLDGMLAAQQAPVTYVSRDRRECTTCDGLRFVHAFFRRPLLTEWMFEASHRKGARPIAAWLTHPERYVEERHGSDVVTPCPDCNEKGQEIVDAYLSRFNAMYAGGPRLPVPEPARALVR